MPTIFSWFLRLFNVLKLKYKLRKMKNRPMVRQFKEEVLEPRRITREDHKNG